MHEIDQLTLCNTGHLDIMRSAAQHLTGNDSIKNMVSCLHLRFIGLKLLLHCIYPLLAFNIVGLALKSRYLMLQVMIFDIDHFKRRLITSILIILLFQHGIDRCQFFVGIELTYTTLIRIYNYHSCQIYKCSYVEYICLESTAERSLL